ncbi:MAG: hypothetical protein H0U57_01815 [Tatlockia sp.]|nr:hypothetical protein [Tatlockia sp.]
MKGSNYKHQKHLKSLQARWSSWSALLILALLYEALPKTFYSGPRGLMICLVGLLLIPMIITHWHDSYRANHVLVWTVNIITTLYLIISVARLISLEINGRIEPEQLLLSSILLWAANIILFALWYWNLDAGGPRKRELKDNIAQTSFLFPQTQMVMTQQSGSLPSSIKDWEPTFVDYLFLSFNTSTAFSPTDTPVLTRWAKCMSMIQALVSLTIIVMLAARAINILNPG